MSASFDSLRSFSVDLRRLPQVVANKVAAAAAPKITELAKTTFAASEDAYGNVWQPGADGGEVKLRRTGTLATLLRYVAIGSQLRVALTVPYAKYQIGKRPVFPRQGGVLPAEYIQTLQRVAVDVVRAEMRR